MNSFAWADTDTALNLLHRGKTLLQIDATGRLHAPAPRLASLDDDTERKGFLLVVNADGTMLRSPYTVQSIGEEINAYLTETQTNLRAAVSDVQKGDEAALNNIVHQLNQTLTTLQSTKKKDTDHIWSNLEPLRKSVAELQTRNQYLMVMTIVLALLVIALMVMRFKK